MVKTENECLGCTSLGLPCIGRSCRNLRVPHYYCDKCGEEKGLFHFDGEELCAECIVELVNNDEYSEDDVYEDYARVEGS